MCAMGVAYITPPLASRGSVCPLITYLAPPEISAIDIGTTVTTKNTAWMDQTRDRSALPGTQPLGIFLSFLEDPRVFEGRGMPRGLRRFRKAHLENILPRGS